MILRSEGGPTRRQFAALLASAVPAWSQDRRAVILERAKMLADFAGQRIGGATPEVMEQARKIAGGTVFFYEHTEVKVGLKDIDWTGGHIHHQEWPAQLNRFFHLRPLAAAYRETHDEQFAKAARSYIEDWLRGDHYATATTLRAGDNTLNMSIRMGSSHHLGWGATLPVFLASPSFDDAFVGRILDSLAAQGEFLSKHLTATGNWRISQFDALVFTSLRFPFLKNATELLETGITGLRNAIATQFLPDGVHIERTPSYAGWMTDVAANYVEVAHLFPDADAHVDAARLVRSLDYGAQAELFGVNDGDAPQRDPRTFSELRRRNETIARLKLEAPPEPPLDQVFADAGQVFSRTSWKPGSDYLAFDASTWGGGHGHLSRLSFVFRSGGRSLVADPGVLTYEMSDPPGPYGKSTAAHSTLNLAGCNQSAADAQLLHTKFTPEAALIHAHYQGAYWQGAYGWNFQKGRGTGIWGDHERVLFWRKGEYVLVLDAMTADHGTEIRNCWQLGVNAKWSQEPKEFAWWSEEEGTNLSLQLVMPPRDAVMQCFEGSKEPLRGMVGVGDKIVPAPLVEFRYASQGSAPTVSAVLMSASRGAERPKFRVRGDRDLSRGVVHHLEIALPDGSVDNIAWTTGLALPVDDGHPFVTDATFVWSRGEKSFQLGGSYLRRL
ncbi:MAG TPA: heparinase II/III family protein [Bryobacteraceae bacterium]|jgi:hypothetical protein